MTNQKGFAPIILALIAFGILVVGGGSYYLVKNKSVKVVQPIACTQEAKICPDGSSVVRTGPNCDFAECPINNVQNDGSIVVEDKFKVSGSPMSLIKFIDKDGKIIKELYAGGYIAQKTSPESYLFVDYFLSENKKYVAITTEGFFVDKDGDFKNSETIKKTEIFNFKGEKIWGLEKNKSLYNKIFLSNDGSYFIGQYCISDLDERCRNAFDVVRHGNIITRDIIANEGMGANDTVDPNLFYAYFSDNSNFFVVIGINFKTKFWNFRVFDRDANLLGSNNIADLNKFAVNFKGCLINNNGDVEIPVSDEHWRMGLDDFTRVNPMFFDKTGKRIDKTI